MLRLLIAGGALIWCFAAPGASVRAAAAGTPLLPSALTIHIKKFMFVPMSATVRAGDRVTVVNDDDEAHTVTAADKSFDSAGLDGGSAWQHVFAKAGSYAYFCELHPYMKASIVVVAAAAAPR